MTLRDGSEERHDIIVPPLGDGVVTCWRVEVGEAVAKGAVLLELEAGSEVLFEVVAPWPAFVAARSVEVGQRVAAGACLGQLTRDAHTIEAASAAARFRLHVDRDHQRIEGSHFITEPGGATELFSFVMPQLGESVTEGTVAEIHVTPGQRVDVDEILVTLDTDKISVELPAPIAGVVERVEVEEDDEVLVGGRLITLRVSGGDAWATDLGGEARGLEAPPNGFGPGIGQLVEQVRLDPSDMAARDALVRWLARRGDPRAAWFEAWNARDQDPKSRRAGRSIDGMKTHVVAGWWPQLAELGAGCRWRAGFVYGVELPAEVFLARRGEISGRCPLLAAVKLTGCDDDAIEGWREWARSGQPERLEEIALEGTLDGALTALVEGARGLAVKTLSLRGEVSVESLVGLAQAGRLEGLLALEVSAPSLDDDGLIRLLEALRGANLERLDLRGCGIGARGVEWIAEASLPRLREITLGALELPDEVYVRLLESEGLPALIDPGGCAHRMAIWHALKDRPERVAELKARSFREKL